MQNESSRNERIDPGGHPSTTRRPDRSCLLTLNAGSSSLKLRLFDAIEPAERFASGKIERIGLPDARLIVIDSPGGMQDACDVHAPDHEAAVGLLTGWLEQRIGLAAIATVGHRVVHGWSRYSRPEPITAALIEELRRIRSFDPDHLPAEIALIEAFRRIDPELPQVACFDTAFHHDLPRVARIVPIPRRYEAAGVRRYGFHGLSYAFLLEQLERVAGREAAQGRFILAHLGSGASLAAVRGGRCLDTTMGFTPTSGLVMGTRSGDLDPGLAWFLARAEGMTAEQFHRLVNHESGLLGVSETSSDLRDLLDRQGTDPRGGRGRRPVLLPGEEGDRGVRRRAGRARHAGFRRRDR